MSNGEHEVKLSDGTVLATVYPLEVNGPNNTSTARFIADVDTDDNQVILNGDVTYRFEEGFKFEIFDSADLDGTYTVSSDGSSLDTSGTTDRTVINVEEDIDSDSLPLGRVRYVVEDDRTSLQLVGKGVNNYSGYFINNFVRLLENFASDDVPPDENSEIGDEPYAQPVVGQHWYNKANGTLYVYDGDQWNNNIIVADAQIIFEDTEDDDKKIYLTGSESNLPDPWSDNTDSDDDELPGLVLWQEQNPSDDEPLFRVLSTDGDEQLRIEYNSTPSSSYIRTVGNIEIQGDKTSYFYGSIAIGDDGEKASFDRTLTVEGDGIAINTRSGTDATLDIDAPTDQTAELIFATDGTQRGTIFVDDTATDRPLHVESENIQIEGTNKIDVVGDTEFSDRVGINNSPPSGDVRLEVTGDVQINSQILGSDQSESSPTYSFTNDPETGIFLKDTGQLAFGANQTEVVRVNDQYIEMVNSDYSELIATNDATNALTTKRFVDEKVRSISWREPVRLADVEQRTDSSDFPTDGQIDNVSLDDGDRVLFVTVDESDDRDIWIWDADDSSWTRDEDDIRPKQVRSPGDAVIVTEGTYKSSAWTFNQNDKWELLTKYSPGINVTFETQQATSDGQETFTLTNKFHPGGDNLQVFVNGQKVTIDEFYEETSSDEITIISPSPIEENDRLDFYIFEEVRTRGTNFTREVRDGFTDTPEITFDDLRYVVGTDNLLIYLNGQKMIRGTHYDEVDSSTIDWLEPSLQSDDTIEAYASLPVVAGTRLQDVSDVQGNPDPTDGQFLVYEQGKDRWTFEDVTLNKLSDIDADSPSDGDVLKWNDADSVWEPQQDARTNVSDNETEVVSRVSDINFGTRLNVTDDGDKQVTIDIPITGSDDNVVTGTAGDDGNLVEWNGDGDAVDSGVASSDLVLTTSSIDALDDVDTTSTSPSDGDVLKWNDSNSAWEPDTDTDTRTGVSDNDSEVLSEVTDINFGTRLDVTDDDDNTVTIDIPITGSDDNVVTGTAGDDGNLVEWNGDGDAVDSGVASGDLILTSSSIDALDDVDTSSTSPSDGDVLKWNDSNSAWEPGTDDSEISSSTDDSTDNAIVRYDGTSGDTIQQTGVVIDDDDNISGAGQSISFETSDFTLSADQAGQLLDCEKSDDFTITVPEDSNVSLPVGYTVTIVQSGSGTVTISPEGDVTVQSLGSLDLSDRWARVTLYKRQTDEWVLVGDVA